MKTDKMENNMVEPKEINKTHLGLHINGVRMPQYQCHERVWALKIKDVALHPEIRRNGIVQHKAYVVITFVDGNFSPITWDAAFTGVSEPKPGWYYVVYEDGYRSFSPGESFETDYTLVTEPRIRMSDIVQTFIDEAKANNKSNSMSTETNELAVLKEINTRKLHDVFTSISAMLPHVRATIEEILRKRVIAGYTILDLRVVEFENSFIVMFSARRGKSTLNISISVLSDVYHAGFTESSLKLQILVTNSNYVTVPEVNLYYNATTHSAVELATHICENLYKIINTEIKSTGARALKNMSTETKKATPTDAEMERTHSIFDDLNGVLPATKYKIASYLNKVVGDKGYMFRDLYFEALVDARIYGSLEFVTPGTHILFSTLISIDADGSHVRLNTRYFEDGVSHIKETDYVIAIASSMNAAEEICEKLWGISAVLIEQFEDTERKKATDCEVTNAAIEPAQDPEQKAQQAKITGYRTLSVDEIALMNQVKAEGIVIGDLVNKLQGIGTLDQRWVSIGKTDLQTGLMALTRAIAQPTTF